MHGADITPPRSSSNGVWYGFIQPGVDRVLAAVGLLVLSPVLLGIAIVIRVTSPGPPIFRQERVGRHEVPFTMYKFRSMRSGVSQDRHKEYVTALLTAESEDLAGEDGVYKLADDDRTTRVGRVLRRTGLDELPQLVNVLKGEMALVGPRPALAYEVEHYRPGDHLRFEVRPGITGYWQAEARNDVDMRTMLEMDAEYVATRGPLLDLRIMCATVSGVVRPTRAAR